MAELKLEKVIRGLELCKEDGNYCYGKQCPYEKNFPKCVQELLADALTLLKSQEARVMDADEIVLSAEPSKWLWVERKGDYCAEAFKAGKTARGLIAFDCETPSAFLCCEHPDEYGKTWRCWTSRPTDEQREARPWQ